MNIVIVNDNQVNLSLLTRLAKRLDDDLPIGFTDPARGPEWCLSHDLDLALADDHMPEIDGLEIGCIAITEAVLDQPGPLDAEERASMQVHTCTGYELLRGSHSPVLRAAVITLHHPERWDGSGYPHGLRDGAILLHARIAAVADVFEALTSERPYRAAWCPDAAIDCLRAQAGTLFDPACVTTLMAEPRALATVRIRHVDA